MRKSVWIAIFISIIIAVLVLGPLITGVFLKRDYNNLIAFYNSKEDVHVKMMYYHRGWWTSDAMLNVEIKNPQFIEFFEELGLAQKDIPTQYMLDLHIQHGPIFYQPMNSSIFGLASIQNNLKWTPEVFKFFKLLGIEKNFIEVDNDLVSFTGNYLKHLKLNTFKTIHLQNDIAIQIKSFDAQWWIMPESQRISGNVQLERIKIYDDHDSILIPNATFKWDQNENARHWWLGKSALFISAITGQELDKKTFVISGLNFDGYAEEKNGMLNSSRQFKISKIQSDDLSLGPFHLQISVNQLNTDAIIDLITAYRNIMRRGELYESQLQQKMYTMLPSVINPGSVIKLDKLDFSTPEGHLNMKGELKWEADNGSLPEDLVDLIQTANAEINLRISINLMDRLINWVSVLPFMNQAEPEAEQAYLDARSTMTFAMQKNVLLIINLARQHLLPENDALELLSLQKNRVTVEEYNKLLTKLFLDRDISRMTNYQLTMQYSEVQQPLALIETYLKQNQEFNIQELHNLLNQWLKAGYIKREQDNYVVSVVQSQGQLQVNDKKIAN